jgi:hypothetical integral membrane protein (TIGR02206 family)
VEAAPFQAFGAQHLITLAVILGGSALLPLAINRFATPEEATLAGWFLGGTLVALKVAEFLWYFTHGIPWPFLLPLQLCDLAAFAAAGALFLRSPRWFEPAYYWAMGGTLQALLTPDVLQGFPSPEFWIFFVPHGLVIAGVCFATGTLGLRPRPGSIARVAFMTLAVCAVAGAADWRWGANYLYLREKPGAASLMDWLGPWPWYLLSLVPVALLLMALWNSPFWLADRHAARGSRRPAARAGHATGP